VPPQLARYPQLYSRIGFAHQYRPLDPEDVPVVLAHYWQQLGMPFDSDTTDDAAAANAITGIPGGNFRRIERLMSQIARVLEINQLDVITPDVVNAARQTLVVGPK
jgi:DNA transposition AAA+ family ATPase